MMFESNLEKGKDITRSAEMHVLSHNENFLIDRTREMFRYHRRSFYDRASLSILVDNMAKQLRETASGKPSKDLKIDGSGYNEAITCIIVNGLFAKSGYDVIPMAKAFALEIRLPTKLVVGTLLTKLFMQVARHNKTFPLDHPEFYLELASRLGFEVKEVNINGEQK
jgi:hypothetical protein